MAHFYIIPASLIKRLFLSSDAYEELLHVGGYLSAKRVSSYADEDVIKHLVYCWYRKKDALTPSLRKRISDNIAQWDEIYEDCGVEDDYGLFDQDGEIQTGEYFLYEDYEECKDREPETPYGFFAQWCAEKPAFMDEVREWHDVYIFKDTCGLVVNGNNIAKTIQVGKSLPNLGENYPYAMISPDFLIKYRDKNKTEHARIELAMLLAINSITGKQEWACTTRNFILARMFGAKKVSEIDEALKGRTSKETQQLKDAYAFYSNPNHRRKYDSIRDSLMRRGLLKCWVPYAKRVFVSPTKKLEEIENEILEFRKQKVSPEGQIKQDKERLLKLLGESE